MTLRLVRGFAALLLLAALCFLSASRAFAQASAAVGAHVIVATTGLTIQATSDLGFGAVIPGTPTTIAPRTAATAGSFEIHGARGAEISIAFSLPTALTVGPHSMPMSFSATSACQVASFQGLRNSCTQFNPNNTYVTRFPNFFIFPPVRYIWIGGTVSPAVGQFPGIYTGVISMTVAYTGN